MDNILRDVPTTIDTQRLTLRWPVSGDGAAYHAGMLASIDELRPWLPWVTPTPTQEEIEARLRHSLDHLGEAPRRLGLVELARDHQAVREPHHGHRPAPGRHRAPEGADRPLGVATPGTNGRPEPSARATIAGSKTGATAKAAPARAQTLYQLNGTANLNYSITTPATQRRITSRKSEIISIQAPPR